MNADCPKCSGTVWVNRDTSSGTVVTRAICVRCGWEQIKREGPATWRIMQQQRRRSLWRRIKGKLWR